MIYTDLHRSTLSYITLAAGERPFARIHHTTFWLTNCCSSQCIKIIFFITNRYHTGYRKLVLAMIQYFERKKTGSSSNFFRESLTNYGTLSMSLSDIPPIWQWLLEEYAYRYGIGRLYRNLVYTSFIPFVRLDQVLPKIFFALSFRPTLAWMRRRIVWGKTW